MPARGPVIFVANHPSAFMDPMVVATCTGRSIHFLAAAEFFGKGLKSWFYKKYLNMIPVHRPSTLPAETINNTDIFSKCFELLGNGGVLLIFPEGNSVTEKRIRKLKTGVARMALGTAINSHIKVEVKIIPIGLNYSNPHRFQSDLFINIGKPLSTNSFSADQSEVVRLTNEVEVRLKETVLHVQNEELDSLVKKIELILNNKFHKDNKTPISKKENEFAFQQKVIKSIQTICENQPQLILRLELRLDHYLKRLRKRGISDRSIAELSILVSAWEFFRLILAFPLFCAGFIINSVPYYSTILYFRKLNLFSREGFAPPRKKINPAFKGSIAMAIGMVFFIVCYLLLAAITFWVTQNIWAGICSPILFYLSGLFTMRYIGWFFLFQQKVKFRKLFKEDPELFTSLIIERQEIIEELKVVVINT